MSSYSLRRSITWPALLGLLAASVPARAAEQPIPANLIERFAQVDARLYRGAQPSEEGFRRLRDLGVRVVVNLRDPSEVGRSDEKQTVESLGMKYVNLPMQVGNFFSRSERLPESAVAAFFTLVEGAPGPVFVHCRRGADRTGAMVGLYRIAQQGWDAQRAYREARQFGMRSWHEGLRDQILAFTGHLPPTTSPSPSGTKAR